MLRARTSLEMLVLDNRVMEYCISKIRYDTSTGIVQELSVNPLLFAPDPSRYSMGVFELVRLYLPYELP